MKCTSCGLPLSPLRTTAGCPRCGTPVNSGHKAASTPVQQQYQPPKWGTAGVVEAGAGTPLPDYQWAQNVQAPVSQPGFSPGPPQQATPPRNSRNTKLGFVVAGLCVLAGGLILILVYFLATSLSGSNSNNSATTTSTPQVSTTKTVPTATAAPSPTTTVYPGQQYIDNAQMSSAVDPNSLQPTQLTTTFKTGQKIYVAFHLHPPGHGGAFCIIWYLNSKQVANFSLPVSATSKYSYAYSIYGGAGAAYVEIYWASTTQCTDQLLAQHTDFTVTN
jgi:predicted RNA-binding Zn-ribbon protein involved in translation (DUF1610 family)